MFQGVQVGRVRWNLLLAAVLLAPLLLSGCTLLDGSMLGDDPLGRTTFQDGGSNNTTWTITLAGRFFIPEGTRFHLEGGNETCSTGGLVMDRNETVLSCSDPDEKMIHRVVANDLDDDGRLSHGDRIEISGTLDQVFDGTYGLTLSLHEEVPLFLLEQDFDAGPNGTLSVALLG